MMSLTGMRGLSEPKGSWKMICIRLRNGRMAELFQPGDVGAIEDHLASRRGQQLEHGASQRGLAAARFAHQGEDLAPLDVEVDTIDGVDRARRVAAARRRRSGNAS